MQLGGSRFVAGTTLDEAVEVLRRLDDQGLLTNTTILGEHVEKEAEARGGRRLLRGRARPPRR